MFEERYSKLNSEQKKAVDTIEGPVMVVAGPGSGKTELLGLRVANILKKVDIYPQNILCLTFTDSASVNMRDRIYQLIGEEAYRVNIHTFHSFGVDVIKRYDHFFYNKSIFTSINAVAQIQILEDIFNALDHDDPLASSHPEMGFIFLRDTLRSISELKKAGLTPNTFQELITKNENALGKVNSLWSEYFDERLSNKSFERIEELLSKLKSERKDIGYFPHVVTSIADSLELALLTAREEGKARALSEWKRDYLSLDNGVRTHKDYLNIPKMKSLCSVYEKYNEEKHKRGYYDYDDMILDVIEELQINSVLRAELQEKYQYILVDEFQDTNDAQMRLLYLLTDNKVHEGRPNIMVVGDDDQAIFKFQGAKLSNILEFQKYYDNPEIITLIENYRSSQEILDLARSVIVKGENRLENHVKEIQKELKANNINSGGIEYREFETEAQEYYWIKKRIEEIGDYENTAIIARRHKSLESILPYLEGIDYKYERQKDALKEPHIKQIIAICRFIFSVVLRERDELLPEILSYPFWSIKREEIWKLSLEAKKNKRSWSEEIKNQKGKIREIYEFLLDLSQEAVNITLEQVITKIIGEESYFRKYYFNPEKLHNDTEEYLDFLSSLKFFVRAIREYKKGEILSVADLIEFVKIHEKNKISIPNTSNYLKNDKAVSLLSVHKAKGLEFKHVFILNCEEGEWNKKHASNKIKFPSNLKISPTGDSIDDYLRLFFVSITRAKQSIYFSSHRENKGTKLSFIPVDLKREESFTIDETIKILEHDWQSFYLLPHRKDEQELLKSYLGDYKLSATHLDNYLDVVQGGPQTFFQNNLLRFPQEKTPALSFGTAIHNTIHLIYSSLKRDDKYPEIEEVISWFQKILTEQRLSFQDSERLMKKGADLLTRYYKEKKDSFDKKHESEFDFSTQNVFLGEAQLTGKIDKMKYTEDTISVYDYKTGRSSDKWNFNESKFIKYKRQLLFYKVLIENSKDFKDKYQVDKGYINFIEPYKDNLIDLELELNNKEAERHKELIKIVYQKIINLDFPDISKYKKEKERGIYMFEEDLLNKQI